MAINKLIGLIATKMDYLTQRQGVIGMNISNANTPNYQPKELESFDSVLQKKMAARTTSTAKMDLTNEKHISGNAGGGGGGDYKISKTKDLYEVKSGGNAVVLEQEMSQLAQNNSDYAMVTGLYKKMVGLLKTAIGHRA